MTDGRGSEIEAVIVRVTAHQTGRHVSVPKAALDLLGVGEDGRIHAVVETARGVADVHTSLASGRELYFRQRDATTKGLDLIEPGERVRITVSRG